MSITKRHRLPYEVSEIAFDNEDALLHWIESQPHRKRTGATRNFFLETAMRLARHSTPVLTARVYDKASLEE